MAQFKRIKDTHADLTIIEIIGELTHGEFTRFLESLHIDNASSRAIFDFRAADLSTLAKAGIKSEIRKLAKFSQPELKAALVFSNHTDFSIGRVISKAVSKEGYLADIRGFYNLYLAKDWLLFQGLSNTGSSGQIAWVQSTAE